jgi:hypothetical protein
MKDIDSVFHRKYIAEMKYIFQKILVLNKG